MRMEITYMDDLDYYVFALMDLAELIKNVGAPKVLHDFKQQYPKEYQQILLGVLEELPK